MARLTLVFIVVFLLHDVLGASLHSKAGLNVLAKRAGQLYFGSATDNGELNDTAYVNILSDNKMFGQITPSNTMKWESTEKSRGVFSLADGDTIVRLAKRNRQLVRGHTCVWHNQLPAWVSAGQFDNATLSSVIATHCSTLVKNWKGQIYAWDVVNEPLNEDGTLRQTIFLNTTGTSYFSTALHAARRADPRAKLYINDFNLEFPGAKVAGMAALTSSLLSQRVPLDGIGFQGHLVLGSVPTQQEIANNLRLFTKMGLDVAFTELDIRMTLPVTQEKLLQQKEAYETVIAACKQVRRCVGVTLWDYTDKYSWIPGFFEGEGAACPWDESLRRKPAYDGIARAFTSH